ncbi:endothelin-1 [Notechis scutatus]|uniref:Endothelin-1 n=1 Tax=Notechis scutatus TaxID=8663 RepID=A0A6J1U5V7_9SAUR|nr:endothelin-1 [Notechis scutatus]
MDYARMILLPLLFVISQGAQHADAAVGAWVGATKQPASAPSPPRRVKRCSCYSLMDKECIYFCHLDIIWINTPERIVPYGLGSLSRTRRSVKDLPLDTLQPSHSRCHCASLNDKKCMNFCQSRTEHRSQSTTEKEWKHLFKGRDCKGLGLKCTFHQLTESKKMKRLDTLRNSIKASSNIAKLLSKLHKPRKLKHNRTYEKQNIWQSLKMTS